VKISKKNLIIKIVYCILLLLMSLRIMLWCCGLKLVKRQNNIIMLYTMEWINEYVRCSNHHV